MGGRRRSEWRGIEGRLTVAVGSGNRLRTRRGVTGWKPQRSVSYINSRALDTLSSASPELVKGDRKRVRSTRSSGAFLAFVLALFAGVFDLGIDLAADENNQPGHIHPGQENDDRAYASIGGVIFTKVVDVV